MLSTNTEGRSSPESNCLVYLLSHLWKSFLLVTFSRQFPPMKKRSYGVANSVLKPRSARVPAGIASIHDVCGILWHVRVGGALLAIDMFRHASGYDLSSI